MYLIMNLAIGGTGGGYVNPSTLPSSSYVNYVRVYQPPCLTIPCPYNPAVSSPTGLKAVVN